MSWKIFIQHKIKGYWNQNHKAAISWWKKKLQTRSNVKMTILNDEPYSDPYCICNIITIRVKDTVVRITNQQYPDERRSHKQIWCNNDESYPDPYCIILSLEWVREREWKNNGKNSNLKWHEMEWLRRSYLFSSNSNIAAKMICYDSFFFLSNNWLQYYLFKHHTCLLLFDVWPNWFRIIIFSTNICCQNNACVFMDL